MKHLAPSHTQHRQQRLARWAQLWLTWFAGFVDAVRRMGLLTPEAEAFGHSWLDFAERLVLGLVVAHALDGMQGGAGALHRDHALARKQRGRRRALIGSALRKLLRPRDLLARIEALRTSVPALSQRILTRLPRGFSRRRPIRAASGDTHARDVLRVLDALLAMRVCHPTCDTS